MTDTETGAWDEPGWAVEDDEDELPRAALTISTRKHAATAITTSATPTRAT